MMYIIICLALIGICVALICVLLKKVFSTIKGAASQMKSVTSSEIQGADAILKPYVKDGKIPSWAYDNVVAELKYYCRNTRLLTFDEYFDKNRPEVVKIPSQFKMQIPTSTAVLTETCVIRFRDFDLETYRRTKQLAPFEQETLDYLCRMWFFSDSACFTLQDGEDQVYACLDSFVDAGNPDSQSRYHDFNVKKYGKYL